MAEALYNASGLGLPIVMTVANRAIGAPINIWNDHSRLDVAARLGLDPALRRDQPGGRRPPRPGVPARRGAVAAGDGVHGRLHPHPRVRAASRCPTQEQVDAFLPPFEPRQVLDPADPVTIGAMVGPEAFTEVRYLDARQAAAGARRDPRIAGRVRSELRARVRRAACSGYRARGRRDRRRRARLGARHDRGRRRRAARARASGSARWASRCFRPYPLDEVRAALAGADRVVVVEKAFARRASAGSSARTCALALSRPDVERVRRGRRPRRPAGHRALAARLLDDGARGPARPALTFLDLDRDAGRARARRRDVGRAARREHAALTVAAARGVMPPGSSSTSRAAFVVGNRLLDPEQRSVQADARALQHAHLRPSRLPGLRRGARRALRRSTPRCARPAAS